MSEKTNHLLQKLSNFTQNYPIGQIIAELHIVIERLEFVDFKADKKGAHEEVLDQIAYLLDRDLSEGIMQFVRSLIDENNLEALLGAQGREFIGQCEVYFTGKKQLVFRTAIHLSPEKQRHVQAQLMSVFPINIRIVFEADPQIGAGFLLVQDGRMVADFSLRSKMVKLLEQYIRERTAV